MMHPTELAAYGRARHEDLLRQAEAYRRGRAVGPSDRTAGPGARPAARWRLAVLSAALAGGALAVLMTPDLLRAWPG
ncbi:MAG TPA: hypothetical protein VNK05_00095 [Chloroflexota bacterium]|nr:hypothetical protein [Chloroflexota bacterium]